MPKQSPVRYAGCEIALATFQRWVDDPRALSRVIGAFERLHAQLSDQSRRIRGEHPHFHNLVFNVEDGFQMERPKEPEYLHDEPGLQR